MNVLESTECLLQLDTLNGWQGPQSVNKIFEQFKGIDALEELQKNPNYEIYLKATELLTKFFEQLNQYDENVF